MYHEAMRRRMLLLVFGGFGLCLIAWGGIKGVDYVRDSRHAHATLIEPASRLTATMDAATKAGIPFAYSDLYASSDETNLADVLYTLEERVIATPEGLDFVHNSAEPAACVKYLASNPKYLQEVQRAASLEYCDLPYQYNRVPFADLESVRPFSTAARTLMAEAQAAFKKGEYERFAKNILAADRLLWRLGQEPGEKPMLTYAGEELRMGRVILDCLADKPSQEGARTVQQVIASMKSPSSMKHLFQLDSAKTLLACDMLYAMDQPTLDLLNVFGNNADWTPPVGPSAKEAIKTRMLEFWIEVYQISDETADPMMVGIKVDQLISEAVHKHTDSGFYMVRTMPVTFEQHGKLLKRAMEVRRTAYAAAVLAERGDAAEADLHLSIQGFEGYPLKLIREDGGYTIRLAGEENENAAAPAGLTEDPMSAAVSYRRIKA